MPTYEYKCPRCGADFELFQKITAKPGAKCPECGARAERQMSAGAGLVFKGSGFYLTDYGRSGQKAKSDSAASSEKSGGEGAGDSSAAKSEAKSEPKSEPKADAKSGAKPGKPKKKHE